jgi:hypothetical protein
MAHNLRITGSLGMGLDEKALDAVGAWRFQPGEKPRSTSSPWSR